MYSHDKGRYDNSLNKCSCDTPLIIILITHSCRSCDSSVSIALGYRLDGWSSRVGYLVGTGNFSLYHGVQDGSGAHPASYPMGTGGSFPGGKAAGS
jgi:hypothetical protein